MPEAMHAKGLAWLDPAGITTKCQPQSPTNVMQAFLGALTTLLSGCCQLASAGQLCMSCCLCLHWYAVQPENGKTPCSRTVSQVVAVADKFKESEQAQSNLTSNSDSGSGCILLVVHVQYEDDLQCL